MQYEILYRGAFPIVKVFLERGELIKAESDAMITMSPTIDVEGKMEGGFLGGLGRLVSGESLFLQTLHAVRGSGEVLLAPGIPGDIADIELDGSYNLVVQKGGFLSATSEVNVSATAQNIAQGLFSGEGFFVVKLNGRGTAFVNSYGQIHPINLAEGEEIIIDNNHLVAWPEYMNYQMTKASKGWISSFTSGEGLVCRFRGPGTVLIQTRNPKAFGSWLQKLLPNR